MSFLATSGCDVWAFYRSSAKKTDCGDAKDDDGGGGGGDDIVAIKRVILARGSKEGPRPFNVENLKFPPE